MQHTTPPDLSAGQLRQVDSFCNAFEMAFQAGKSPRAEDFLLNADETLRRALLPELLNLELHYRPDCSRQELAERFPELEKTWLDGITRSTAGNEFPPIPGYYIMEELGRGGMGVVYLAADLTLHRRVALKMLHRSSKISADHRRRFLGEARAAARLHHPNLVQIFDSSEFEGHPFLVFELVEGGTLAERLQRKPLTFEESAELMETLCRALQFAHDRHIIHRDLKPSNILLGIDGVPRITDFGLAKRLDEDANQTISGQVIGTPSYMAPEQAAGLAATSTPAVDIYSLGSIFYELLTGRPPLRAASVMETLEQLRTRDPVPPRRVRPEIPRDLETICLKCLQKEPSRRYISAQVIADEIGRFRRGESIVARPVGAIGQARRWCRRHPLTASLAVALVAVVIAAFWGISRQWHHAVAQQKLAEINAAKFQTERDRAIVATARAEKSAVETEQQRAIAELHLAAAESRFEKAQAPIQELIRLGVELVRQPQMEARGRQALERATEFREALLQEKTDDSVARFITASTLHTLAWTLLEHGEFSDADQTYCRALQILTELQAQNPGDRQYLRHLRNACLERGVALSHLDQPEAAEQSCRDSVTYGEQLVTSGDGDVADQIGLGNALTNWAGKLVAIGRQQDAVSALQRSVDIHREVISGQQNGFAWHTSLSLALSGLASHLWSTDQAAAESLALEALELRRAQVARTAHPRNEAMKLIASLNQLTNWYTSMGRLDEAERLLAEATEQARITKGEFPSFFGTRYRYIMTLVAARRLAAKKNDKQRTNALVIELKDELATATADFPDDNELKELDAWFRHRWALILAERGETADAMTTLKVALDDLCGLQSRSSDPRRFRTNINHIARAVLTVGTRFEFEREKLQALAEWVAQDPQNPNAHNALAWRKLCVKDESLRDAVAAEQLVRRAIELKADQSFYHNTLGTALYYQGRLDEASAEFERSLLLETPLPAADWCFLAMILHRHGNTDQAETLLEKAVAWHNERNSADEDLLLILEEARMVCGSPTPPND